MNESLHEIFRHAVVSWIQTDGFEKDLGTHRYLYLVGPIRNVRKSREYWTKLGYEGASSVRSEAPSVLPALELCSMGQWT